MNELATDSSGHLQKIIGQHVYLGQAFQITPEGDGRMTFHITICLTSCATRICSFPRRKFQGVLPPLKIHSYNRTENAGKKDDADPEK
mmetsp:Transcript_64673/g.75892  ORF Transcript_64673/g.75892 Transcript_64673/m.75892 type:complete len:88 (-) Transcript_64673:365-628(-)